MTDLRLSQVPDADLESALRRLAPAIDWPSAERDPGGLDLAAAVRARIEATPASQAPVVGTTGRRAGWRLTWRPARRALVFALLALLALAAIAGAVGFGLPGLRLFLGGATASPPVSPPPSLEPSRSPAPGRLGAAMSLGERVELADLDKLAGFHVAWPSDASIGPPDAAYFDKAKGGQVSLVWAATAELPSTVEPGVGLVLSQFRGTVDEGFFGKAVGGGTSVDPVDVGDGRGYWLSGDPHFLFWEGPDGIVTDERRWVGDALLWSDGVITYRLETTLGRAEAIRLAASLH